MYKDIIINELMYKDNVCKSCNDMIDINNTSMEAYLADLCDKCNKLYKELASDMLYKRLNLYYK